MSAYVFKVQTSNLDTLSILPMSSSCVPSIIVACNFWLGHQLSLLILTYKTASDLYLTYPLLQPLNVAQGIHLVWMITNACLNKIRVSTLSISHALAPITIAYHRNIQGCSGPTICVQGTLPTLLFNYNVASGEAIFKQLPTIYFIEIYTTLRNIMGLKFCGLTQGSPIRYSLLTR